MIIDIRMPPNLTGDNERDIRNLSEWSEYAVRRLMSMLRCIDGDNITEIPIDKIPMDYIKKEISNES